MLNISFGRKIIAALSVLTASTVGFITLQSPLQASADEKSPTLLETSSTLAVSAKADRSNPLFLDGQKLSGTKWIYINNPVDVNNVAFYLDQPDLTKVNRFELAKPFDFMGTKEDGNAAGFDTTKVANGRHSIAAVTMGKGQKVEVLRAEFTIDNKGQTPAPGQPQAPVGGNMTLKAELTGAEVPGPGDSDGTGSFIASIDPKGSTICYSLTTANLGKITDMHIHKGGATDAGPIVAPLQAPGGSQLDACITISKEVVARIAANPQNYYVNIHTTEFPKGAIRGQLEG